MTLSARPRYSIATSPAETATAAAAFRPGMRILAGTVTLLTTTANGRRYGLTATSVCSLSADPPRLLACVNQRGETFAALEASGHIAVNVLAHDQFAIAQRFSGMHGNDQDRFTAGSWQAGEHGGIPVLDGALCVFECRIAEIIGAGTHGILICDVQTVKVEPDRPPLLYCDGRFTTLADQLTDPRYSSQF